MVIAGVDRSYITQTSNIATANQPPADTVILLHDYNSSGQQFFDSSQIAASFGIRQMRVIAPDAIDGLFNSGSNPNSTVDDVAFLNALIARYHAPQARLVVLGIGTGASMAARFATRSAYPLDGVGMVAGFMFDSTRLDTNLPDASTQSAAAAETTSFNQSLLNQAPLSQAPLRQAPPRKSVILYGEADPLAPAVARNITLNDGRELAVPGMQKTVNLWGQWLRCSTSLSAVSYQIISQKNNIGCGNNSQFIELSIKNFGHYWAMPIPAEPPATDTFGPYLNKLNTTQLMLNTLLGAVE